MNMAMNLCMKENFRNFSYLAKIQPDQNCGCVSCIRRCCKPGFIYKKSYCHANSIDVLKVSVYSNKTHLVNMLEDSYENFIVGVPKCKMFRLNFPEEEFYVQRDTKDVWVPQYNKFYNNSRYCVDEFSEFTPYLCFSSTSRSAETIEQKIYVFNVGMI